MPPRTRATASTASTVAPLAAAPRRRLKVTPIEPERPTRENKLPEEMAKPTTRSTRSKKAEPSEPEQQKPARSTRTMATTTKTTESIPKSRGRPKKAEPSNQKETENTETTTEQPAEKPKRATRATRATATTSTVSSEAKERPIARATRTPRTTIKENLAPVATTEEEPTAEEVAPKKRNVTKKKVTFQDILEDDKENQPITARASKKTAATKSAKATGKSTGLKAKPVRKPAASTRGTKRTKEALSDNEEDTPKKKIQRVLTPKKITQVARAATPDQESDDELNGGKTPMRDLSLSPRRPLTGVIADAIVRNPSPAKRLDFTQSLLHQSAKKQTDANGNAHLMSPARRPPVSTAKLFPHTATTSPMKMSGDGVSASIASPARRPLASPAKLLFPTGGRSDQRGNIVQNASSIFQSPKRSAVFDAARMFPHSAIKPLKNDLGRSEFFSSPAKRVGKFSPLKDTQSPLREVDTSSEASDIQDDNDLNDMQITELVNEPVEIEVTSHQRASVSPIRTYKLSADELQLDFDDSILPIGSPLKVTKSPIRSLPQLHSDFDEPVSETDELQSDSISIQSTPRVVCHNESTCVSWQALQTDNISIADSHSELDLADGDDGDDTIVFPEAAGSTTPRSVAASYHENEESIDELAPSPHDDIIAKFIRTPGTPASLQEHELTNINPSPSNTQSIQSVDDAIEPAAEVLPASPEALYENELTIMGGTPNSIIRGRPSVRTASPASVNEAELTLIASKWTPVSKSPGLVQDSYITDAEDGSSPVSIAEHELTIMGGTPKRCQLDQTPVTDDIDSPVSLDGTELTLMADSFTPKSSTVLRSDDLMAERDICDEQATDLKTPASVAEHELTMMSQSSPGKQAMDLDQTPTAAAPVSVILTPDLPIPRKFNLHTVVSKVPLKPEGDLSPFKFQIKKRKRPLSVGGQPDSIDVEIESQATPAKSMRRESSIDVNSGRKTPAAVTPAANTAQKTSASRVSTVKSAKRVVSTPSSRAPLAPVASGGVLAGVLAYVDVRTSEGADASAIYHDLLINLGARVVKDFRDNLTHIIFKDGNTKILERARLAQTNIKVVGVVWPLECDSLQSWVNEEEYLINMTPTENILNSVAKSIRRKSMEPSLLVSDGSGSVKRSKSRSRASVASRKSVGRQTGGATPRASVERDSPESEAPTPHQNTAKKQADLEKNSLTAAWKSINASHNLGDDTPARRTLELLQKSYQLEENCNWDDSILSSTTDDQENTPLPPLRHGRSTEADSDDDTSIIETGLTPAPYRVAQNIGSAPAKAHNSGMMSYRERVEEMERRELRDNAFGTNKGTRGKGGKRMTMFGFGVDTNQAKPSPLRE